MSKEKRMINAIRELVIEIDDLKEVIKDNEYPTDRRPESIEKKVNEIVEKYDLVGVGD